jgi:hypothetical protein
MQTFPGYVEERDSENSENRGRDHAAEDRPNAARDMLNYEKAQTHLLRPRHYSDAARNDQLGRQALHHLVSLIARQASHRGDPPVWSGSRGSNVQDFTFNLQGVTGPGRIWPLKFAASSDDSTSERHTTFNQKAHGDRSSVPPACCQARKKGVFGSLIIKVEGLRVELTSKCFDLLLIDNVGSARKTLPDLEIIEIELIAAAVFRHDRSLQPNRIDSRLREAFDLSNWVYG